MVDFGHIEHLMGPETGLLTPKTPKLPSEGLMWTNFGPGYQKSSLWVVITDIRHYSSKVGVFWEYLLSQNGFFAPTMSFWGTQGGPKRPKIKMARSI